MVWPMWGLYHQHGSSALCSIEQLRVCMIPGGARERHVLDGVKPPRPTIQALGRTHRRRPKASAHMSGVTTVRILLAS